MKIICVGKNYSQSPEVTRPETPLIFLKPDSAILPKDHPFFIPEFSNDITLEVELAVRICRLGKYISARFAHKYYDAYTAAVDFTAVDIMKEAQEKGMPWELSKGFDGSVVLGEWIDKHDIIDTEKINFSMSKNDITVNKGVSSSMLFSIDEIIEYVSRYYTLKIGDVILTGAPQAALQAIKNDYYEGFLEDKKVFGLKIK